MELQQLCYIKGVCTFSNRKCANTNLLTVRNRNPDLLQISQMMNLKNMSISNTSMIQVTQNKQECAEISRHKISRAQNVTRFFLVQSNAVDFLFFLQGCIQFTCSRLRKSDLGNIYQQFPTNSYIVLYIGLHFFVFNLLNCSVKEIFHLYSYKTCQNLISYHSREPNLVYCFVSWDLCLGPSLMRKEEK